MGGLRGPHGILSKANRPVDLVFACVFVGAKVLFAAVWGELVKARKAEPFISSPLGPTWHPAPPGTAPRRRRQSARFSASSRRRRRHAGFLGGKTSCTWGSLKHGQILRKMSLSPWI